MEAETLYDLYLWVGAYDTDTNFLKVPSIPYEKADAISNRWLDIHKSDGDFMLVTKESTPWVITPNITVVSGEDI